MSTEPYMARLAVRLLGGLSDLDDERRERHRTFLLTRQASNGGFRGRQGEPDLYYTSFAARALALLGRITPDDCERLADFLVSHSSDALNVIDLISWLNTALVIRAFGGIDLEDRIPIDWLARQTDLLEASRTGDGGYAKVPGSRSGSTYHSFLAALVYESVERPIPDLDALIRFIRTRKRDDGGFADIAPMRRGGTNPTAAAVGVLVMTDSLDADTQNGVGHFLKQVKNDNGGFEANTRIPIADGLSTFTAIVTALDIGMPQLVDPLIENSFVTDQLEVTTGGFRAGRWDDQPDVEYTYYGLGILSLLGGLANDVD